MDLSQRRKVGENMATVRFMHHSVACMWDWMKTNEFYLMALSRNLQSDMTCEKQKDTLRIQGRLALNS